MQMDFWGAVVPNYVAAVGGLSATVLAVVSLVWTMRTARAEAKTRDATLELVRFLEERAATDDGQKLVVHDGMVTTLETVRRKLGVFDDTFSDRF
ncbi:hypothetical protein [Microbacterium invictum]|uniref:Uncharacterized protein n=1 Tax=Microbacterium invictum TaxID=515415 RepID=A0ABZ0VIC5_9MICO|nr:hypothetical protein [Microbacterium invictum]WQB71955.1 hypothetical protein T9R20_08430 [Microbacterium invictum]